MRAVIYARYSAGRNQTEQSIEGQVTVCTKYCETHGLTVQEVYADHHITGKTDDRPEFQRLMADSKLHKFDAIVVYKTDRFSRDKYDAAIYKRELKKAGVVLHYAAETIPDGPEGIILESLMEGLAEYYSAELAQKIKRGMYESAKKCKVLGKCMPLGYRASEDHTYEIDPTEAEIVREIFRLYIEGKTQAEIVNELNARGYKTSRENAFNKNSIPRIISNQKYIGIYSAAGVTIEGGLPAIVDYDTFMLAQRIRAKRASGHVQKPVKAQYLLSSKLICAYCKKPMTGVSGTSKTKGKYFYYYCSTARHHKELCQKKHVKQEDLEALVVQLTADYVLRPDVIKLCIEKMLAIQAQGDDRDAQIKKLNKLLQENKKSQNGLLKALESGLATDPILRRLDELEKERLALEGEVAYQKTKQFGLTEDQMLFFLEKFMENDGEDPAEYRKRIINAFVSSVELSDDKIRIYYNLTDENANGRTLESDLASVRPSAQKVDLTRHQVERSDVTIFVDRTVILLEAPVALFRTKVAKVAK